MFDEDSIHPPHAPRRREHVGMIRWHVSRDGEWTAETVRGQFVEGDRSVWRVRLYSGVEIEYDLTEWAPFDPRL